MMHNEFDSIPSDINGIVVGRDVHYFLRDEDPNRSQNNGQARAAKIVRVMPGFELHGFSVNLMVFLDGINDVGERPTPIVEQEGEMRVMVGQVMWVTSVPYSRYGRPGTWRWMRDG